MFAYLANNAELLDPASLVVFVILLSPVVIIEHLCVERGIHLFPKCYKVIVVLIIFVSAPIVNTNNRHTSNVNEGFSTNIDNCNKVSNTCKYCNTYSTYSPYLETFEHHLYLV